MASANALARTLKALHVPGNPLILANVYDHLTATAVADLPSAHALATASYSVALAAGTTDDALTLETNLAAARTVAAVAVRAGKPLTVDLQDGYGAALPSAIRALVAMRAVGCNLEDRDNASGALYSAEEATRRVRLALATAAAEGVPDFVVNARCDVLAVGGVMDEVIARGKAYLEAGATTVFVWGGGSGRGVAREEVARLVAEFGGRLNVMLKMQGQGRGALSVAELAEIGVARISVGPQVQVAATGMFKSTAEALLKSGNN